jgi:hypothetical protein
VRSGDHGHVQVKNASRLQPVQSTWTRDARVMGEANQSVAGSSSEWWTAHIGDGNTSQVRADQEYDVTRYSPIRLGGSG